MQRALRLFSATALIALVASLTLAACGEDGSDAGSPDGATELVVYSPQGDGDRGAYIAEQAKKDLGIDITFFSGGGGELTDRLIAEKSNAQADVALGFGQSQLYRLAAAGVLEAYRPSWGPLIPEEFSSGEASFTLFSQTPIVMAYNPEKLSPDEAPTSWEDLADPVWKDKFVFPALESQTGQAALTGLLWRYADNSGQVSDAGWDTVYSVLTNSLAVPEGAKFDWTKVSSGEVPIVVDWLGGVQVGETDNKLDLNIVATEGGTPFVTAGIGQVKGTANAELAQKFIDWFGSEEFQPGFVKATNSDTPINPKALAQLPEAGVLLEEIKPQAVDWEVASSKQTEWFQKIRLEVGK